MCRNQKHVDYMLQQTQPIQLGKELEEEEDDKRVRIGGPICFPR
jgi:hypothetical protein